MPLKHALTNAAYRSVTVDKMVKALRRISNVKALRRSGESNYVTFHNYYEKFRRQFGAPQRCARRQMCPLTPKLRHWNGRVVRKFETLAIYLKALRLSRDSNHIRAGVRSFALKRHQDS